MRSLVGLGSLVFVGTSCTLFPSEQIPDDVREQMQSGECDPHLSRGGMAAESSGPNGSRFELWHAPGGFAVLAGRAPEDAVAVRLEWPEDDPIVANIHDDRFFLVSVNSANVAQFREPPVRFEAVDPDGDVVATQTTL